MTLLQATSKQTQEVLEQLSSRRRQRMRKHVQLLFLGLDQGEVDPIVKLLRASRLSPRGQRVETEQEFLDALSERSWDLILCTLDRHEFTVRQATNHLKRLNKDIPVIQIVPEADSHQLLLGMRANIQAVVPLDEVELLTLQIRRELDNLEVRRQLRFTEANLSDADQRSLELMQNAASAYAYCSTRSVLLANDRFTAMFGYDNPAELVGLELQDCITQEEHERLKKLNEGVLEAHNTESIQLDFKRKDGSHFKARLEVQPARFEGIACLQLKVSRSQASDEATLNSKLDLISGLYKKSHMEKELDRIIQRALDGGADCSLLYIHLDQYAAIMHELGNEGCDQIMRDIGAVLTKHVNSAHLRGRIGDDAFAVVYYDPSPDKALELAEKLCMAIAGNLSEVSGHTMQTTASIGIAGISDNAPKRSELLKRAAQAAEDVRIKSPEGNGIFLYVAEEEMPDQENEILAMLRRAIEQQNFKLLYQPIVSLKQDAQECYYEVLLRLMEDEREVSPGEFMEVLSRNKMSLMVDRWVIKESMRQLQKEYKRGQRSHLFINLTGRTLKDVSTISWFATLLRKSGLPAENIIFQISELDAYTYLRHAKAFTQSLRELHCRICIKHHGASPDTDLVLSSLQPEIIKLDGAQVQGLEQSSPEEDKLFYQNLSQLHAEQRITIAPLVEGTQVMSKLWRAGVNYIQGNYLQPPKEAMEYDFFDN